VGQSHHGKVMLDRVSRVMTGMRKAEYGERDQEIALQAAAELLGTDWREGGESRCEVGHATAHDQDSCTVSSARDPREMVDANVLDDCSGDFSGHRRLPSKVRVGPP
jgi:hypothetical protein